MTSRRGKSRGARRWIRAAAAAVLGVALLAAAPGAPRAQPAEAERLSDEAAALKDQGRYAQAIPVAERALALWEKALGPDHPRVATALVNLAALYQRTGQIDRAEPLLLRAIAVDEKALGPGHPDLVIDLNNLAQVYRAKHDDARAEPLFRRAVAILEASAGASSPRLLPFLGSLLTLYLDQRRYDRAEPIARQALSIVEKVAGPEAPDVATAIENLAEVYWRMGAFDRVEPLYRRSLAIYEKALGPGHPLVARTLLNLALVYPQQGDYRRAEPLLLRAIDILEKAAGADHPEVAHALTALAGVYMDKGSYARAEPLLQRALAIQEKALGPDDPSVASTLNRLGGLHKEQGDYAGAEPLYRRALAILEKGPDPNDPAIGLQLNNLAELYRARHDDARAEPLLLRALAILEKALGPSHPDVEATVNNLGHLYADHRDFDKAEQLLSRALALAEKAHGPWHPYVAEALDNLASLYADEGNPARADMLMRRSLAIWEKTLGKESWHYATTLGNLATLAHEQRDLDRAEPLYQQALAADRGALGPTHPLVAQLLDDLASLYQEKGDVGRAVAAAREAADIQEKNLALVLAGGSDDQKQRLLDGLFVETAFHLAFALRAGRGDRDVARLALTTVLRRKGRAIDAAAENLSALRSRLSAGDQQVLSDLAAVRSRLAKAVLGGPGDAPIGRYREDLARLEKRADELEAAVSAQGAGLLPSRVPVTVDAVQAALPEGAALVEWIVYIPADVKGGRLNVTTTRTAPSAPGDRSAVRSPRRYAACVLHRTGDPAWVDLGDAPEIDADVQRLRAALADPRSAGVKAIARSLDEKVMAPVRALLGGTRWLYLAPDEDLNLIPFGALVDEAGDYLLQHTAMTYLTSGRDLVRLAARRPSRQEPVVIGDPAYGDAPRARASGGGRRSVDLGDLSFPPLRGAAEEARDVAGLLGHATLLTGDQATEAAVKQVHGPRVLHLATHGFYLPAGADARATLEEPLLRSGMALAGANARSSGDDDGLLTALEASALDLDGTKIVTLSGCRTGVGAVSTQEGVYGLRRALVVAGAETQVMSLWEVDDEATRALMKRYYEGLGRGGGRGESMRQAQLAMADHGATSHPYYWASFIVSGDASTMDGAPVVPELARGPRGCACAAAGDDGGHDGAPAMAAGALLAATAVRRRRARRTP
jgi:MYXO-CTERM domain-containing protein